jgi:signal transduction histidine kinase
MRPRPGREVYRADGLFALLLAVGAVTVALLFQRTGLHDDVADPWVWVLGIGLATLPLTVRRRFPVPAALACALGFFLCRQMGVPDMLMVDICLFLALYSVGAWEQNRRVALWSRVGIVAAMCAWIAVNLLLQSAGDEITEMFPDAPASSIFSAFATFAAIQIITNVLYFAGAFYFGERAWNGARTTALLEAQGRELERERQTSAAQAVALDRLGIARELHDVVAHHVSVMGIQAAAARRSLERDPEQAVRSLEVVEESAHTAVTELRGLVRTLREPAAESASSALGVAQLPELVEEARRTGTPAALIVVGEQRPLPLLVDVALYRVAQEALTNVRKHAGSGAEAEVRLRFTPTAVEVEVADNGMRRSPAEGARPESGAALSGGIPVDAVSAATVREGGGLGLRGMQERMGAVGGSVLAQRREQGGFLVRARVELGASAARPSPAGEAVPSVGEAPSAEEAPFLGESPREGEGCAGPVLNAGEDAVPADAAVPAASGGEAGAR